jgi:hypothetical protein
MRDRKAASMKCTASSECFLVLDLPIKTVSEINRRDHWRARHRRCVEQQTEINIEWKKHLARER